jgi:YHS domain-containing protein
VIRFLLLAILLLLVARAFWRLMDGIIESAGGTSRRRKESSPESAVKLVRDPVCGTYVAPRAALSLTAGGSTHYFCSEECRRKFVQ